MTSASKFKVTMLGCGSSGGVPLINDEWGVCNPLNPKNRRRRASIMIETDTTCVLVDAGPDIRNQLLDYAPKKIDALIITHDHADHTHGLDELRFFVYGQEANPLPVYMSEETETSLHLKFPYLFAKKAVSKFYPALFKEVLVDGKITIGDLNIDTWLQPHGHIQSLGMRIGDFAYSTDAVDLDETHFSKLENLETWIFDVVRYRPHFSHAHMEMGLSWLERLKPKRAFLTHMSHELDYDTLVRELPSNVRPGYDGLQIECELT